MRLEKPVISLCVPTFNRSDLLKRTLPELAGQVRALGGLAELLIGDNCSSDATQEVIRQAIYTAGCGDYTKVVRRNENIGALRNILQLTTCEAKGAYCLVIGDDDLLHKAGLSSIVQAINQNEDCDVFYLNFLISTTIPVPGMEEPCGDLRPANENLSSKHYSRWIEILSARNELGTNIYCHVIKTDLWRTYWRNKKLHREYSSPHSTYPHTMMLIESAHSSPAYYIGNPILTASYASTSWSSMRPKIHLEILPQVYAATVRYSKGNDACMKAGPWVLQLMESASRDLYRQSKRCVASSILKGSVKTLLISPSSALLYPQLLSRWFRRRCFASNWLRAFSRLNALFNRNSA